FFPTRGCGGLEHPGFPAPPEFQMAFRAAKHAHRAARSRGCGFLSGRDKCACTIRSVIARRERDEAIHFSVAPWIASLALAMTAPLDFAVIADGATTSVIFILADLF